MQRLMTVQELSDLLQIPEQTIYWWHGEGLGPKAIRIGKHLRYRPEAVEAWLDAGANRGIEQREAVGA